MRYSRLSDLLRLALRMQGTAEGLSLADIEQTFEISRRTAERMRDAVREIFPQIQELGDPGQQKRWRLPPGTLGRMADVTVDDLSTLLHAAELADREGDAAAARHLHHLADKLRAGLGEVQRRKIEPDIEALLEADGVALRPGPRERIEPEFLATLREAILAGVWIEADHRARSSGRLSRNARLGPLAILLGQGRQYLVAWSGYRQDVRLFSLAGFERITPTANVFERPKEFDLKTYLAQSFGIFQESEQDIVWRFTPDAARDARHYLFHPTQEMTEEADGSLTVRFRAGGLMEMAWHLFRWGNQVEVIAPEALRVQYHRMLEDACSPVSDKPQPT